MITLIHGEDTSASRKKLQEEKTRVNDFEVVTLNGEALQPPEFILTCESASLFQVKKLIIIENLLLGGVGQAKQQILEYLSQNKCLYPVILWEGREIDKAVVKKYFLKHKEIFCQPPALLFRFLDSIGTSSGKSLADSFHALLRQEDPEFIFVMLLRQWRYLIVVKDLAKKNVEGLASWQIDKFLRQARFFTLEELIYSYRQLLAMDYKIKSGQTPYSLKQLLDIFFLTL